MSIWEVWDHFKHYVWTTKKLEKNSKIFSASLQLDFLNVKAHNTIQTLWIMYSMDCIVLRKNDTLIVQLKYLHIIRLNHNTFIKIASDIFVYK